MRINILTLFPSMFEGPLNESILGRARERGLVTFNIVNIRDFAHDKHRVVDDSPFGGGPGMLLKPEPIFRVIDSLAQSNSLHRILLMTPQGRPFDQHTARELAPEPDLVIICGRYQGVDERIRSIVTDEISIGDYVLSGGELPALVIIDAICRLVPGVIGNADSVENDSFSDGMLGFPQYTRPAEFRGMKVPSVLLSGDHEQVRVWRRRKALERTYLRRPDLLDTSRLSETDLRYLEELKRATAEEEVAPDRAVS